MEWFGQLGPVFFLGLTAGAVLTITIAALLIRRKRQKLLFQIASAGTQDKGSAG